MKNMSFYFFHLYIFPPMSNLSLLYTSLPQTAVSKHSDFSLCQLSRILLTQWKFTGQFQWVNRRKALIFHAVCISLKCPTRQFELLWVIYGLLCCHEQPGRVQLLSVYFWCRSGMQTKSSVAAVTSSRTDQSSLSMKFDLLSLSRPHCTTSHTAVKKKCCRAGSSINRWRMKSRNFCF